MYDRTGVGDFVCFTDDAELRSEFWRIELVPERLLDATRAAKRIKHQPHRFLGDFAESLYVDNVVRLKVAPAALFERFLEPAASPLVCFRNPWRDCVYDEAEAVIAYGFDDPERVRRQMREYRRIGYPEKRGLSKATLLLRRHNAPDLVPVMEHWFEQILLHSHRDQLALDVVSWMHGFSPEYIGLHFLDFELLEWPVVAPGAIRLPRDFDDDRYLALHPDVAGTGMPPRRHFIAQGAAEGRAYK